MFYVLLMLYVFLRSLSFINDWLTEDFYTPKADAASVKLE